MDFFSIETMGDIVNEDLCLLEGPPEGMETEAYRLMRGVEATSIYPSSPRIQLREDNPGMKLTSFLGNIDSLLIVSKELQAVIVEHCRDVDIEYLPFVLHDHRGRVHSSTYKIVNPLGSHDCLHQASGIHPGPQGSILSIDRFVIDAGKATQLPALFRIAEDPTEYVIRDDLARAMMAGAFTNLLLSPLEVRG